LNGDTVVLHERLDDFWTLGGCYQQHEDWQQWDEEHARIERDLDERPLHLARILLEETGAS